MSENLTTIIITIITLAFSGGAWKFYEMMVKNKRTNPSTAAQIHVC